METALEAELINVMIWGFIIGLTCLALLASGVLGITLSVPLQAPAVILFGLAAILAAIQVLKAGSAGVWESKVKSQKVQTPSTLDKRGMTWLLGLVLVSIVYFVGRAWFSPVRDLGVEDLMLILPASILYLIGGYALRGKPGAQLRVGLAITVIVLLLLHIGSCVLQIKGGDGYSLTPLFTGAVRSSEGHVTGMYGYYGSFANFAVIAGLLSLSLGIWGRMSRVFRTLLFLLGSVALALAVYSQSRSALISMILAVLMLYVLFQLSIKSQQTTIKRRLRTVSLIIGTVVVTLGGLAAVWLFSVRGGADIVGMVDSGVRSQFWAMAGEQFADYPILGAGSRSYSYLSFLYWSPNLATEQANPEFVHNEYLQLLADYGVVGLLFIVALLVWHGVLGFIKVCELADRVDKNGLLYGSNAMALTMAGVCGMTAMAVHVCFDFRTHLLANLLLLVCCVIWTLPVVRFKVRKCGNKEVRELNDVEGTRQVKGQKSSRGRDGRSWGLALVLLALGLGSVGLGGLQLWAGGPLLQNQMAKEDGAWIPQNVDRDVWIPALEESLRRSPQWRRYQRLGALYRLEVNDAVDPKERRQNLLESEQAYLNSLERHPYNPIPKINLAAIYTQQKRWQEADAMYASASEMAKARERWFQMHSDWGAMHLTWGVDLWQQKKIEESEWHFKRAKSLYLDSYDYGYLYLMRQWTVDYSKCLLTYARFLDDLMCYEKAELLYADAKSLENWHNLQSETHFSLFYSRHLYVKGKYMWHLRKPEEAHRLMLAAQMYLNKYRSLMDEDVSSQWYELMTNIEEVLQFLEAAGIQSVKQ